MKKILGIISVASLTLAVFADNHHVDAQESFYVRGDVGPAVPYVSKTASKFYSAIGPTFNVGIGYKFDEDARFDISFRYASFNKNNGNGITAKGAMVNGYYDFVNDTIFSPYVTIGLGFARVNSEQSYNASGVQVNKKANSSSIAWDAGLGSKMSVTKNIDLDLAYKFASLGKTIDNKILYVNQITAGLAYNF